MQQSRTLANMLAASLKAPYDDPVRSVRIAFLRP